MLSAVRVTGVAATGTGALEVALTRFLHQRRRRSRSRLIMRAPHAAARISSSSALRCRRKVFSSADAHAGRRHDIKHILALSDWVVELFRSSLFARLRPSRRRSTWWRIYCLIASLFCAAAPEATTAGDRPLDESAYQDGGEFGRQRDDRRCRDNAVGDYGWRMDRTSVWRWW